MRRQAERDELVKNCVEDICVQEHVSSPLYRSAIVRHCIAQGVRPAEFDLIRELIAEQLNIHPNYRDLPPVKITDPKTAKAAQIERMNSTTPAEYAAFRRENQLPVFEQHLRPVPAAPPTAPEDPDAAYAALRTRLGLPPSTSTSIDWARRQRERRGQ